MKFYFALLTVCFISLNTHAQFTLLPYIGKVKDAEAAGIRQQIDKKYKSAIDASDKSKCVFKTSKEQDALMKAYQNFLMELGNYLSDPNFKWGQPTKCWNRIYFNKDGSVEYYVFNIKTEISDEKTEQYKALFRSFISTHKIAITATEGFAQCSPVTFIDK